MFLQQLLKCSRSLPTTLARRCMSQTPNMRQAGSYTPNALEKRMLVWTGKFKSLQEVPNFVSAEVMERCRNTVRIRVANIMIVLTVVGCGISIYTGKEASKRGESLTKQNMEWHKRYNELNSTTEKQE